MSRKNVVKDTDIILNDKVKNRFFFYTLFITFLQKMYITAIFHHYTQRAVKKKVFCLHVYNANNQRIGKFLKIPFRKEILEWPECRSLADGWKWKFLNKSVKRHIRLKYNRILWTAENASCPSNHLKSAEKRLRIQEKRIHVDGV